MFQAATHDLPDFIVDPKVFQNAEESILRSVLKKQGKQVSWLLLVFLNQLFNSLQSKDIIEDSFLHTAVQLKQLCVCVHDQVKAYKEITRST